MDGIFQARVAACLSVLCLAPVAVASERQFSGGLYVDISVADGEPANDIPGLGLQVRYLLSDRWAVGAALGRAEYDFETPAAILGITQASAVEPVDALAESTNFEVWAERLFTPGAASTTWFAGAGLGAASVDVPDVAGPRADGGQFDIRTEVGTEIVVAGFAGVRRALGKNWYAEFRVHARQHFADWRIEDRPTGQRSSIDDYLTLGGHLAFGVSW